MIDKNHPIVKFSEIIHFMTLFAILWLLVTAYSDQDLLLQLYRYLFGDVSTWFVLGYIGMRSDAEIAYFYLCNCAVFVLHANLVFMYSVTVDLKHEWKDSRSPLTTLLNKNIWGRFWPHYAIRVFRHRQHSHEQKLKDAVIKLVREVVSLDLPVSMLFIMISYPFLYSRLESGGFLSIFGWQSLTFVILMFFWNQVMSMLVLFMSIAHAQKEK